MQMDLPHPAPDTEAPITDGAQLGQPGRARPAGTPVVALPPSSQLDESVLDALPLALKRELELAYGEAPNLQLVLLAGSCSAQRTLPHLSLQVAAAGAGAVLCCSSCSALLRYAVDLQG